MKPALIYRSLFVFLTLLFNSNDKFFHLVQLQILGNIVAPSSPSHWAGQSKPHWLAFYRVQNLTIGGTGTLDGQGSAWWDCKRRSVQACRVESNAYIYMWLLKYVL